MRDALQTVPLGRSAECALRMPLWRTGGVPCGTDGMRPTYARAMFVVNIVVNRHQIDHHRVVANRVPRAGVVNARRPGHRPGRSEAESIDDAEHGASIIGAMVVPFDLATERASCSAGERGSCANRFLRNTSARFCGRSGRATVHAGGAILLHELGSQTATRDTTNDGVNDPVRAPWGQVQGTTAGSFTPSLVQ